MNAINAILGWLAHHGYLGLYGVLAAGVVALLVTEDIVLIVAGCLVARGQWSLAPTWAAASAGCMTGITVSYLIGRFGGRVVLNRFGDRIGLSASRRDRAEAWFHRFGKWSFFLAYFIPGVRHFTGLSAGASHLRFPVFALFAWSGAFIWSTTFLTLGRWVGEEWPGAGHHQWCLQVVGLAALCVVGVAYWLRRRRNQPYSTLLRA